MNITNQMQKGIIHLVPLIIIAIALLGASSYWVVKNKSTTKITQETTEEASPTPSLSVSPTPASEETGDKATPTSTSKTTPVATKTPTQSPQVTLVPTQKPVSKGVCGVNAITVADNLNGVWLTYSLTSSANAYMTEAQWDFNGDGTWDTDMSPQNGSITRTFDNGIHTVKLRLKISNGGITDVCSKNISVPVGISVSFSGQVFSDNNCNNTWDPGEDFVPGITVNIFRQPENSLFKTLTTDSGGNFGFSTVIPTDDNLTIRPGAVGTLTPPYYKIFYDQPSYTLNTSHTSASNTISIIPAENTGACLL